MTLDKFLNTLQKKGTHERILERFLTKYFGKEWKLRQDLVKRILDDAGARQLQEVSEVEQDLEQSKMPSIAEVVDRQLMSERYDRCNEIQLELRRLLSRGLRQQSHSADKVLGRSKTDKFHLANLNQGRILNADYYKSHIAFTAKIMKVQQNMQPAAHLHKDFKLSADEMAVVWIKNQTKLVAKPSSMDSQRICFSFRDSSGQLMQQEVIRSYCVKPVQAQGKKGSNSDSCDEKKNEVPVLKINQN